MEPRNRFFEKEDHIIIFQTSINTHEFVDSMLVFGGVVEDAGRSQMHALYQARISIRYCRFYCSDSSVYAAANQQKKVPHVTIVI